MRVIPCLLALLCSSIMTKPVAAADDSMIQKIDGVFDQIERLISHTATRLFDFLVTVARVAYSAMILLGVVTWLTGIWGGRAGTRLIISGIMLAAVAEFVAL